MTFDFGACSRWYLDSGWNANLATSGIFIYKLTIRTEPAGALVVLGDHAQKSPATFEDFEPRKYKLRIMSSGIRSGGNECRLKPQTLG